MNQFLLLVLFSLSDFFFLFDCFFPGFELQVFFVEDIDLNNIGPLEIPL